MEGTITRHIPEKVRKDFNRSFALLYTGNGKSGNGTEPREYEIRGTRVLKYGKKIQIDGETEKKSKLILKSIEGITGISLNNNSQ